MNRLTALMLLSATACVALAPSAHAIVVGYTGGTHTQNFDTLPNAASVFGSATLLGRGPHALADAFGSAGLDGWWGANHRGSSTSTEFRAHDGSLASGAGRGVISFGVEGDNDRALGVLATSNQVSSFGVIFRNDTSAALDSLVIEFFGEQWRRGNVPTPNSLTFGYVVTATDPSEDAINDIRNPSQNPPLPPGATLLNYTAVPALDFFAPNTSSPTEVAINGNAAENRQFRTATLSNLGWAPGHYLTLRWVGVDQSGQDDGVGIDDFVLRPASTGPNIVLGDFNFDGFLDAGDIDVFTEALLESAPYAEFIANYGAL
ncbi:MAG: hypothetical protein ACK4PI_12415, partial [Tepidisphaerales bacterium]